MLYIQLINKLLVMYFVSLLKYYDFNKIFLILFLKIITWRLFPIILLKLSLPKLNNKVYFVATIVILLVWSYAINPFYPKYYPYLSFATYCVLFITLTSPDFIIYNDEAAYPYVTIVSPFLYFYLLRIFVISSFSFKPNSSKNFTSFINLRFYVYILLLISYMANLKVWRSIPHNLQFYDALHVALLGALYKRANYPNPSPGPIDFFIF